MSRQDETETHQTSIYPTEEQHTRWAARADDRGMSVGKFVVAMTEAGLKKFDAVVEPDESVAELREQRNDLETQLRDARRRIERLEDELHHGERRIILEYVRDNPGCSHADVVRRLQDKAPERVRQKLDSLEGDAIRREDGLIYLADKGDGGPK